MLISGLILVIGLPQPAMADGLGRTDSTSKVTVSGNGRFSSLEVTIGQTKNLVNQVVDLTWTGGAPTSPPGGGVFATNYLQIMQCWSGTATDDSAQPDRSQCQYGGHSTDTRGGIDTAKRLIPSSPVDPGELASDPSDPTKKVQKETFVTFNSVTGESATDESKLTDFFGPTTTNDVPYAISRADGTGLNLFEIQTGRESPGLGCGELFTAADGSRHPRSCWLVIVPRDDVEVDGTTRTGAGAGAGQILDTSPLSETNWANRIQVKLEFLPVGAVCRLGAKERPTAGSEVMTEAISRWQPALCASGPVYGFSQVPDSVARRQLASDQPGVEFLTTPVPGSQLPESYSVEYAPVALSGIAIGFMVESRAADTAPEALKLRNGEPLSDIKLDARLVAKLLTESYYTGVDPLHGNSTYLLGNPGDLTHDPEFLALNPDFKDQALNPIGDALVAAGLTDTIRQLWTWIASDQDALDFVNGLKDPWGMRVNPFFQGMDLPRDDVPKSDPLCYPQTGPDNSTGKLVNLDLCTLDQRPYAADMHESDRDAVRGDTLARNAWSGDAPQAHWTKAAPHNIGTRAVMAVTDTATAERYRLPMAQLRNASGHYVAPTDASLLAGLADMTATGVTNVLAPDPTTDDPAAYPLTTVTYAVTAPGALVVNASAGVNEPKDYADLIRYAVGAGQVRGELPGQLPFGYVPLPEQYRQQALAVADHVLARRNTVSLGSSSGSPPGASSGSDRNGSGSGATPSAGPAVPPSAATAGVTSTSGPAPVNTTPSTQKTPSIAATAARWVLRILLIVGGASALLSPALPWMARRLKL